MSFTDEQEAKLVERILVLSERGFSITVTQLRVGTYHFAVELFKLREIQKVLDA